MTYKDLLDGLVQDSGDAGSNYRANAIRWLNLARQDAASRGSWKSAKNSAATFVTSASNTTGVYTLDGMEQVVGDEMYDQSNDGIIQRDTENELLAFDANRDENGFPRLWADSGMAGSGERQIRLWPIPLEVFTIGYIGSKLLIDVTSANELTSLDPYFGPLSTMGSMLQAGLRYYHDLNNNEDIAMVGRSQGTFYKLISTHVQRSGVDTNSSSRMEPINRRPYSAPMGRFDPGHYGNR